MRRIAVVSVALLAGSWPVVAIAQEIAEGERIVTIHKAELRSGNDTTGTVPEGNVLDVKHVNGDWFWVSWTLHKTVKGWIGRSDVIPFSQAEDYFEEELKRNPKAADAYNTRGALRIEKGDLDLAIEDFNQAIRLNAKFAVAYDNRGLAWGRKKEYDKAIADYSEAIRLDPKYFAAYEGRGLASARHLEHTCLFCRAGGTTLPMVQRTIEGGHDRSATRPRAPFRGACETDAVSTAGIGAEYGVPDAVETR